MCYKLISDKFYIYMIFLQTEILFYKNIVDGTIVLDMRPRVNLGGGLFFNNSLWQELTGNFPMNYHPNLYPGYNQPENQNPPIILYSNCCGRLVYLVVPEFVQKCPLCGCFMFFLG